ncbi:MAG: metallophosphoesterase [Gemmatimonadota bacterium]|nr:metallophosphoesterase [Gemmatimonadota bacterium]
MRVAALYDIHGNLPALEAVLVDLRNADVDSIVVGGDVVPGPLPRETLACLESLDIPVRFLHGNGESAVLAELAGKDSTVPAPFRELIRWSARQLEPEQQQSMSRWPPTIRVAIPELGDVLFCHATPRSDTEIFTRLTPEERVAPVLAGVDAPLVVCGHTHMQFDRMVGWIRVVNAGSVGMPFGEPGAYWLLLGPDVQLRHTTYDLAAAADRVRRTSYPQAAEFATRDILKPRTEREMLDAFSN